MNVWFLRSGKDTPYRGGRAADLKAEFKAYGLPTAAFYLVGILKVGAALALLAGIFLPQLVRPAAAVGGLVRRQLGQGPLRKPHTADPCPLLSRSPGITAPFGGADRRDLPTRPPCTPRVTVQGSGMPSRGRHQSTSKEGRALIRKIEALDGVIGVIIGRSYGGKSLGRTSRTGAIRIQRPVAGGLKAVTQSAKGLQEIFIRIEPGRETEIAEWVQDLG